MIGAFCIVDRESGARENFAAEGIDVVSLVTLNELRS